MRSRSHRAMPWLWLGGGARGGGPTPTPKARRKPWGVAVAVAGGGRRGRGSNPAAEGRREAGQRAGRGAELGEWDADREGARFAATVQNWRIRQVRRADQCGGQVPHRR